MITVMMTGAQTFEGLLRDWLSWKELYRANPDAILVRHGFVGETLTMVEDPKQRLSTSDDGSIIFFNGVPLRCACNLAEMSPEVFDCGVFEEALEVIEQTKEKPENRRPEPVPVVEKTPAPAKSLPTKKTAKPKSKKR